MTAWFPEPAQDTSVFEQARTRTDWITVSHSETARAMREFLNRNIAHLPEAFQPIIVRDLQSRWQTAYVELIVARMLQVLGATLEVERPIEGVPTRIDYVATFPDGMVAVEAMAPLFGAPLMELSRDRAPLLDIIRVAQPNGWGVQVTGLPRIGPQDSKAEFREAVREMLSGERPFNDDGPHDLVREISSGVIQLTVYRTDPDARDFGSVTRIHHGDSQERIRVAVNDDRKRRQARNAGIPALLAIGHPVGEGWTHLRDFDSALYGERIADPFTDEGNIFRPTGEFLKRIAKSPPYAGVLAFPHIGLDNADEPVLYHDPRSTSPLPAAFSSLEQRRFDRERHEISIERGKNPGAIKQLGFMQRLW